jgi:hypothetical protein
MCLLKERNAIRRQRPEEMAHGYFIVKGAPDQFCDLIKVVKGFDLKAGIQNSLDTKLQNALKGYQAALAKDRPTACNQMSSFINEAQAQTGKALTQTQANQLIISARQLKVVLGVPLKAMQNSAAHIQRR